MISFRQADLLTTLKPQEPESFGKIFVYAKESSEESKPIIVIKMEGGMARSELRVLKSLFEKAMGIELSLYQNNDEVLYEVYKAPNRTMLSHLARLTSFLASYDLRASTCSDWFDYAPITVPCVGVYGFTEEQLDRMVKQ